MKALLHGFRHYFDFTGRDRREVFWRFIGITQAVLVCLLLPACITLMVFWHELMGNAWALDAMVHLIQRPSHAALADLYETLLEIASDYFSDPLSSYPWTCLATAAAALWGLLIYIPTLSAISRRLRDAGQSLWWVAPPAMACLPLPLVMDVGILLSIGTLVMCARASALPEPGQKSS